MKFIRPASLILQAGRFRRLLKRSQKGKCKKLTDMKDRARAYGWDVGPKKDRTVPG